MSKYAPQKAQVEERLKGSLFEDAVDATTRKVSPDKMRRELGTWNWATHHTKILLMTHDGKPVGEIAKTLKLSTSAVSKIRASTYFIQKLAALNTKVIEKTVERKSEAIVTDKARQALNKAAYRAAIKLIKLAAKGEPTQRIQLDACKDILDRAGLKPVEIVETRERVYSPEEVAHAKGILLETQSIIERLSNQSSPFVLGDSSPGTLASPETDQAHALPAKNVAPGPREDQSAS